LPESPLSTLKRIVHVVTLTYQGAPNTGGTNGTLGGILGTALGTGGPTGGGGGLLTLTFKVTPQQTSFNEPARTIARKTLGGFYVDESGPDVKPICIEGHTGYNMGSPYPGAPLMDGYQCFMALVNIHRNYLETTAANALLPDNAGTPSVMNLYLWEEGEYWQVVPNGPEALQRSRNSEKPLLFSYRYNLIAVRNLNNATSGLSVLFANVPGIGAIAAAATAVANAIQAATAPVQAILGGLGGALQVANAAIGAVNLAGVIALQPILALGNQATVVQANAAALLASGQATPAAAVAASTLAGQAGAVAGQAAAAINAANSVLGGL
jgi:hypothetical protein